MVSKTNKTLRGARKGKLPSFYLTATSLRLSGHSRGTDSLVASVLATRSSNLLDRIDRVTFMNEAVEDVPSFLLDGKTPNPDPKTGMVRTNRVEIQNKVPTDKMVP